MAKAPRPPDPKTRERQQRWREGRRRRGMHAYEVWLDADTAHVLAQLQGPEETPSEVMRRALYALQGQQGHRPP